MTSSPHFDTICEESRASVGLVVSVVVLETLVLLVAGVGAVAARKTGGSGDVLDAESDRKGSPDFSLAKE